MPISANLQVDSGSFSRNSPSTIKLSPNSSNVDGELRENEPESTGKFAEVVTSCHFGFRFKVEVLEVCVSINSVQCSKMIHDLQMLDVCEP